MHLLPLLLIPVLIWMAFNAKRWGLFAEIPVDPDARVAYWASQALAHLKVELAAARGLRVEENQLFLRKGRQNLRIWGERGQLYKKEGASARESLGELGKDGQVTFVQEVGVLHVSILAKDGELSRQLEASITVL